MTPAGLRRGSRGPVCCGAPLVLSPGRGAALIGRQIGSYPRGSDALIRPEARPVAQRGQRFLRACHSGVRADASAAVRRRPAAAGGVGREQRERAACRGSAQLRQVPSRLWLPPRCLVTNPHTPTGPPLPDAITTIFSPPMPVRLPLRRAG